MKPNPEKDFWHYHSENHNIMEVYCIDGIRRGKYSSVQYLIENYNMSNEESFQYINNIRHI